MKKFDKEEYNKLCAKFLGYILITPEMRKNPSEWSQAYWEKSGVVGEVLASERLLKYHSDWNWIHKVIDKIESIQYKQNGYSVYTRGNIMISYTQVMITTPRFNTVVLGTELNLDKKEAIIEAIWRFLLWYFENEVDV